MRRSASASKRGRSPAESELDDEPSKRQELAVASAPTSAPGSVRGAGIVSASAPVSREISPSRDSGEGSEGVEWPDDMPRFLTLGDDEIANKYSSLLTLERLRLSASRAAATTPAHPSTPPSPWQRIPFRETAGRDSFRDIFVWAANRVKLDVPPDHNDYINASPIKMSSHRTNAVSRYIAMQAPKPSTADHVWRMCWSECEGSGGVIVMLTVDGFPYFPRNVGDVISVNESDEFGDGFHALVTCESVEMSDDGATEVRKLVMKRRPMPPPEADVEADGEKMDEDSKEDTKEDDGEGESKVFWHLTFTLWPDHGIPDAAHKDSLVNLIALSRRLNTSTPPSTTISTPVDPPRTPVTPSTPSFPRSTFNPVIVHCRAGVGRSGTFIALDFLLHELAQDAFRARIDPRNGQIRKEGEEDPVYTAVNQLRMQRAVMVQTEVQYKLIYEVLRERWIERYGMGMGKGMERERPGMGVRRVTEVGEMSPVHDPFRT